MKGHAASSGTTRLPVEMEHLMQLNNQVRMPSRGAAASAASVAVTVAGAAVRVTPEGRLGVWGRCSPGRGF